MTTNLRAAIIGMGVGEQHISGYEAGGKCEVVALCDIDPVKREAIRKKYPDRIVTADADEILNSHNIDVVSIASYDNFHADQIIKALRNGKHVFVEKPLCLTKEEAKAIRLELSRHSELMISSNLILRRYPRFIDLKARIGKNEFGRPFYIEADYEYGRIEKLTSGWRGQIPYYSVVLGGGVHMIDLLIWLFGDTVTEVSAMGNRIACDNTPFRYNDLVVAILRFSSGLIAKVTCNFGCVLPHFHNLRLFGTHATYINRPNKAEIFKSRVPDICPELIKTPYPGCVKGDMIPGFISAIIDHGKPDVDAEDIFRAISVCFAIEESVINNNIQKVEYL